MDIRKFEPMPTRPCEYFLALQDDSVFADFETDDAGCIYLVRISFDGFGCCEPKEGIGKIDAMTSKYIVTAIKSGNLKAPNVTEMLRSYFRVNKSYIWEDALLEHELI